MGVQKTLEIYTSGKTYPLLVFRGGTENPGKNIPQEKCTPSKYSEWVQKTLERNLPEEKRTSSRYSEWVQKTLEKIYLRKNVPPTSIQRTLEKFTRGKTYPLQVFRGGTEFPRKNIPQENRTHSNYLQVVQNSIEKYTSEKTYPLHVFSGGTENPRNIHLRKNVPPRTLSKYSECVQKTLEKIYLRKNVPTPCIQRWYRKP